MMTLIRAKAPLRLGLAGGGTDVSPYSDIHGGAILNACIGMYAYATIIPNNEQQITLEALDRKEKIVLPASKYLEIDGNLDLLKGVYNRIVRDFGIEQPLSFTLQTFVDAPAGSGLGSSSTLVVAILKAFAEWLNLPLGEYDIAHLAFEIERIDLAQAGGKQDQYAATFGGVNFMEFYADDKVIVNPLKIKSDYLNELEQNIVLYYTGTSRLSSKIIEAQRQNVQKKNNSSIDAMHELKRQAQGMKEAILRGELAKLGELLDFGWQQKKKMAEGISNAMIDDIYEAAISSGATGGKISGAGGGGFMMFYCPVNTRYAVIETLERFGGKVFSVNFAHEGASSWRVK